MSCAASAGTSLFCRVREHRRDSGPKPEPGVHRVRADSQQWPVAAIGHLRWLAGIQGADFDKDPFDAPNREMLSRLRRGEESQWDIAFYRHEMAEADLCKPARGLPLEEALRMQKQSHESVMRNQRNRERDLYHPDVVYRNRSVFGKEW